MTRPGAGAAPDGREAVRASLLVVAGAMLWGTTGTAQALAPAAATPATVGAARLAVGTIVLLGAAAATGLLRGSLALLAPGLRGASAAAAGAMAAYQVAFFAGVARAGVAIGTIVALGSAPVLTGLLTWLLRRERPLGRWWLATALSVAGVALLVAAGDARGPAAGGAGVLAALAAGACYATYAVASKALLRAGCGPGTAVTVTFAGAALLLLPALVVGDARWLLEPRGMAVALWLGAATVAAGYLLFASGLRVLAAPVVATLTLAEPVTAGALGVLLLGERTGASGFAGALLLAAGLGPLVAGERRHTLR